MHLVGNPMIDTLLANLDKFDATAPAPPTASATGKYVVATLHRPANVDSPGGRRRLVRALHEVAAELDLIIPLHPRGRAALQAAGLGAHPRLHVAPPARLPGVHRPGQGREGGDHRLRWRAGGNHLAPGAVPDPEAQHRAAHHRDQRKQPPGHPA